MRFIHKQIYENHPGVYNKLDGEFNINLQKEFLKAEFLLSNAQDKIKQQSILDNFVESFNDHHLGIRWFESNSRSEPS